MRGGWSLAVVLVLVLVCVACGARTDLDEPLPGSPVGVLADASAVGSGVDASTGSGGRDALADVPTFFHDAPSTSPAEPDATCSNSKPQVQAVDCGIPNCCKFSVTWTCGSVSYGVSGACQGPTTDASPGQLELGCVVDGQPEPGYNESFAVCPCDNPNTLAALAEAHCGP